MGYLLDTHAVIWLADSPSKIPQKIKDIILMPNNEIYISSISLWEIAIKMSIGKLSMDISLNELFNAVENSGFNILHISKEHLLTLSGLPILHKDPFDRLLIATALAEGLTIITIDENIQKYEVLWIW